MKQRVQMDFRVTVLVDIDKQRPGHLADITDPVKYAKLFVSLSPHIHGSHLVSVEPNGKPVSALEVVDTEVVWVDAFINS